ncbi:MAG: hypothetical protein EP330_24255 [Deltaproteobacteria bacterium]|nr:MAG: hypothetical protein EP330_24255 [Deltaproteobacteria bacterium]
MIPAPLDAAMALSCFPDPEGLRVRWTAPFRVVVAGVTGVGKTTLANRLTGSHAPTGLGGVTRGVQLLYGVERVVVDTEGIDDERIARAVLTEPLATADAVIWVLDGRAPSTATERRLLDELCPDGTPVHVIVARGDLLEPDEREEVAARVRRLHGNRDVAVLDLRHDDLPVVLLATHLPSPTRLRDARRCLAEAEHRLPDAPDVAPFVKDLKRAWRSTVISTRDAVLADVHAGTLTDASAALDSLCRAARRACRHFREVLDDEPFLARIGARPPSLPLPEGELDSPLASIRAGMAGQAGAERELRAAAGRWLAEGDLRLVDWEQGPLASAISASMNELRTSRVTLQAARDSLSET